MKCNKDVIPKDGSMGSSTKLEEIRNFKDCLLSKIKSVVVLRLLTLFYPILSVQSRLTSISRVFVGSLLKLKMYKHIMCQISSINQSFNKCMIPVHVVKVNLNKFMCSMRSGLELKTNCLFKCVKSYYNQSIINVSSVLYLSCHLLKNKINKNQNKTNTLLPNTYYSSLPTTKLNII
jgi:hypothetical protein